eukprot:CAMPEP_0117545280 /NCGR_PEP_ID=MMETSP0784-20121206/46013_1 /TAXON_ID=39447 /ORGANISM="" /LENGTH=740 /DNA_ID=CAMNT_0005342121 /DNA_START=207 /DNA_END=2429 /DNA_ORIENTATION=-
MIDGGLLLGLVASGSVALLVVSCVQLLSSVLTKESVKGIFRLIAAIYAMDGVGQLPRIIAPAGSIIEDRLPTDIMRIVSSYPMSRTGIFVTTWQLRFCPLIALRIDIDRVDSDLSDGTEARLWSVIAALPLRYMSMMVVTPGGPTSWIMYGLSVVLVIWAVTPARLRAITATCLEKAFVIATRISSVVYNLVVHTWPKIKACMWAVFVNRCTRCMYELCLPYWKRFHTCFMPLVMSTVAYSCFKDVQGASSHEHVIVMNDILLDFGKSFCGASAAVSTLILGWHGASRLCRYRQPDPLRYVAFLGLLHISSNIISSPWRVVRVIAEKVFEHIICPAANRLSQCVDGLSRFARDCPLPSIILVLLCNVLLVWQWPKVLAVAGQFIRVVGTMSAAALGLQAAAINGTITDSGLAIVLIAVVQIGTHSMVANILSSVRVVRNGRTGDALNLDELNDLAAGMADPRQCAQCGFGPVDYRGCANLRAHHMEVAVRGGNQSRVSNACPRCGWFTSSLNRWPGWDGDLQTESGRAMLRQRVWCEVVVGVRAVAKALLFPYGLLKLGNFLNLPPSVSAFLAFSYLIPWVHQNMTVVSLLNDGTDYSRARRLRHQPPTQTEGADNDAADCGATATATLLPSITESEALANILSNAAAHVWLQEGDICSVCLDPFPPEAAVAAAGGLPVGEVCEELRSLSPPVVVLRCGHALHVQCAEAAVAAGGAHHVRCPLCRQPVTLQGEAASVMFS